MTTVTVHKYLFLVLGLTPAALGQQTTQPLRVICSPATLKIVKMVTGHPIQAAAVLEAVRQWRWRPLKLNGVVVETEATITVDLEQQ